MKATQKEKISEEIQKIRLKQSLKKTINQYFFLNNSNQLKIDLW
jgi:hypothetical protein